MKRIPVNPSLVGKLADQVQGGPFTSEDIATYLRSHPPVLAASGQIPDRVDPSGDPIAIAFYTDGEWIWSAELARYVSRYGHLVPEAFIDDLEQFGIAPRSVSPEQIQAAAAEITGSRAT